MKLKALFAACSLAFAGQAFALGPTTTPDVQMFISGASAQQLVLGQLAVGVMQPGTIDVYFDQGTNGKDYRAYFGTMKTDSSIPASLRGKNVLIRERAAGGSVYGVNPVAQATAIAAISVDSACTDTGTTDPKSGAPLWTCPNTVDSVPDAGVSDVEPQMFVGINLPAGATALSATDRANLTVGSQFAAPFAIILTDNLQGMVDNLSRMQASSLLGGSYQDWGMVNASLAGNPVVVCRRAPGSGTQASTNNYLFGFPCSSTALAPATHLDSVPGGYTVIENGSSGKLAACMTYVENGTPAGQAIDVTNGSLVTAGSPNSVQLPGGQYGIGIMGLDRPAQSGETYHFSNLDGIVPTLENAANGTYGWISENGYQYRNKTVNGVAAPTGAQLDLINLVKVRSGDPAILGDPNLPVPGVLGLAENGYVPPATWDPTHPTMKAANFSNSCQAWQLFY